MPSGHGHREGGGGVLTAGWYQVEIAGQNQSPIILIIAAEHLDTGWLLLLPDSYTWRARACQDEDCVQAGPWPDAWSFTYQEAPTPMPQSPQAPDGNGGGIQSGYTIVQRSVYFLAGQAVAVRQVVPGETNNLLHLHSDHLGSNSVMSYNNGGGMVAGSRTRYLPFGGYRTAPTQTFTDHGYTGQKHNDDLGLIYYNARYYIAGIARFASADTIVPDATNPQAFNRYTYVLNSPFTLIDPSGHRPSDGCDYEGCSLLNGFDSDSTWQAPDGTQTPWDPVAASDQDYNPLTEAVIPIGVGILALASGSVLVEYVVVDAALPTLIRLGNTIASWLCLNDGDCVNEVHEVTHISRQSINWLANQLNRVNHIVSPNAGGRYRPGHDWSQLINYSGNLTQDYEALQVYLDAIVQHGAQIVTANGQAIYAATVNGVPVEVIGNIIDGVFVITDAWIIMP